ncbi:hypothetical protein R5R35_013195 [Gryllus longicercus]|uniref:Accessory gland protein n=1 Tax=Gryllus longicercus TaxID=2509291 RepID=A0AAN9V2D8_9ORTH
MKFLIVALALAAVVCAQETRDKRGLIGLASPLVATRSVIGSPAVIGSTVIAGAPIAAPLSWSSPALISRSGLVASSVAGVPVLSSGHLVSSPLVLV